MMKPVPDKAEVAVDLVGKNYGGTFDQTARFPAHLDKDGISLRLHRHDPPAAAAAEYACISVANSLRRSCATCEQYAQTAGRRGGAHDHLRDAAEALYRALAANPGDDLSNLKPQDEVLLLHIGIAGSVDQRRI
jgi:predicted ATPase